MPEWNNEQRRAIECYDRAVLVMAPVGTGKTKTITDRAALNRDRGVRSPVFCRAAGIGCVRALRSKDDGSSDTPICPRTSNARAVEQGLDHVTLVQADSATQAVGDFGFGGQAQQMVDGRTDVIG